MTLKIYVQVFQSLLCLTSEMQDIKASWHEGKSMLYESLWTVEIRGSDRYEHADVPQRLQQASETAANICLCLVLANHLHHRTLKSCLHTGPVLS